MIQRSGAIGKQRPALDSAPAVINRTEKQCYTERKGSLPEIRERNETGRIEAFNGSMAA